MRLLPPVSSVRRLTLLLAIGAVAPLRAQRIRTAVSFDVLQAAVVRDSNDAAAHYNLGVGHWSKGRYDEAERSFRSALAIEPRFALAHLALAYLPFARRDKLWDETLEGKVPTEWVAAVRESDREYRRAMLADPMVDLKIMGAVEPGIPAIWQVNEQLAELYDAVYRGFDDFRDGKYASAYGRFQQLAHDLDWDGHPDRANTTFLYFRGLAAAHLNRLPEAIEDVATVYDRLRARETERRDSLTYLPLETNDYRYLLADLRLRSGQPRLAEPLFQQVVEQDAGNYMAHVRLADLHETAQEWEAAIAERRHAADANPEDASLLLDLGVTLGKAGKFADAEVALADAATANPRDTRSLYWLGIAREQLGKTIEARQAFERFIALAPSRYARQIEAARVRMTRLGGGE
jgi:tetratricopeptide (TPR) repeat protein